MHVLRRVATLVAAGLLLVTSGCAAPGQSAGDASGGSRPASPTLADPAAHPSSPVASSPVASSSSAPAEVPTPTVAPSMVALSPTAPSATPVDETGAVPWVDTPGAMFFGSPLPVAALPTSGRPCRAADSRRPRISAATGGGGETLRELQLTNMSSTPCILNGFPRVVADGARKARGCRRPASGALFVEQETSATMNPGSYTMLSLATERDCDARYAVPNKMSDIDLPHSDGHDSRRRGVVLHDNFRRRMRFVHWPVRCRRNRSPSTRSRRSKTRPRRSNSRMRSTPEPPCTTSST